MTNHLAHNFFSECARLRGDAGEYCYLRVAHDVEQRDCAAAIELPSGNVFALAQERFLAWSNSLAAFHKQSVSIERIDAFARLLFGETFFFHCSDEHVHNADAGGAGAEHRYGLLTERNTCGVDSG